MRDIKLADDEGEEQDGELNVKKSRIKQAGTKWRVEHLKHYLKQKEIRKRTKGALNTSNDLQRSLGQEVQLQVMQQLSYGRVSVCERVWGLQTVQECHDDILCIERRMGSLRVSSEVRKI